LNQHAPFHQAGMLKLQMFTHSGVGDIAVSSPVSQKILPALRGFN
jgi:hypothetical protein